MSTYTIDATNKRLGRIAGEAARVILGKSTVVFARNNVSDIHVQISNASKMDITDKKLTEKTYERYSGYPGGRKVLTGKQISQKKGYRELVRLAIFGMLPSNKLRARRIKQVVIND